MTRNPDIILIGSGMSGLSLAALLGQQGFAVTVIDRETPEHMATEAFDSRTIALSAGSRDILAPLGIWERIAPFGTAIETIDVQEQHAPFILNFAAHDVGSDAFGWIFPNSVVRKTLLEAALQHKVQFIAPDSLRDIQVQDDHVTAVLRSGRTVSAPVLVGADGRFSRVRAVCGFDTVTLDYKQTALVGLVTHEHPHLGLAVERFYPSGPFAVLPFHDDENGAHRSAIVWTQDTPRRKALLVPDHADLDAALAPLFDARYGTVRSVGRWAAYPLGLQHAKETVQPRIVLISDAAHAIHPIAGQGLNLGMRDVGALVDAFTQARDADQDIGLMDVLGAYQRTRRTDVLAMVAATDVLNRLFAVKGRTMARIRDLGLGAVDRLPPLKRFFMRTAMGK